MALPVTITDGGGEAQTVSSDDESGLLVYTKPRQRRTTQTKVAINSAFGANMAIDGASNPTVTENIHNGIDNVYWTGSNVSGGAAVYNSTFSATGWPVDGTQSIDFTPTTNNSLERIDKGSTLDLTPYTVLKASVYITSWPTSGTKEIQFYWEDATQTLVGNTVDLSSYIDNTLFNETQIFTIPLSDFGVSGETIQSFMVDPIDVGGGAAPNWYMDVITLQDNGEGFTFEIEPTKGTDFHLNKLHVVVEDAYTATAGAQHGFSKTGFLGVSTLANGISTGVSRDGLPIPERTAIIRDLRDWMRFPQLSNVTSGYDGTNTWLSFDLDFSDTDGVILKSSESETLQYTISDDLSGLVDFRVYAEGYVLEDVEGGTVLP